MQIESLDKIRLDERPNRHYDSLSSWWSQKWSRIILPWALCWWCCSQDCWWEYFCYTVNVQYIYCWIFPLIIVAACCGEDRVRVYFNISWWRGKRTIRWRGEAFMFWERDFIILTGCLSIIKSFGSLTLLIKYSIQLRVRICWASKQYADDIFDKFSSSIVAIPTRNVEKTFNTVTCIRPNSCESTLIQW